MNFDEFTGQVQHRLQFPSTGEAVRAIRATLATLGQRIQEGEATDLGSNLPMEIGWYLTGPVAEHGERFDWREFVARVAEIEGAEPPDAAYHAQVVMDLVSDQVPASELRQLRDQLPEAQEDEDWGELFAVIDAGGWGDAQEAQVGGGPQPGTEGRDEADADRDGSGTDRDETGADRDGSGTGGRDEAGSDRDGSGTDRDEAGADRDENEADRDGSSEPDE